jgi:hypothetical protein
MALAAQVAGATEPESPERSGEHAEIEITNAVSHPSAVKSVGVVYLTVRNRAAVPDRLRSVHTDAAGHAMLHETVMEGEMSRMVHPPDGFGVPANGELILSPGGMHIMLMDLREPLRAGGSLGLTLRFERAGERRIRVSVVPRVTQ